MPDLSRLSVAETLQKLRVLTKEGLTNAGVVLFGKDPGEFYPNLFVKIGRFGDSVVDMKFQEVCEGNLILLLHEVMEQLEKKFLIKPVRFEGVKRIEELEYPVAALREMLLNALVHRNYMGSMTQIKVMHESLSIWNAGELPPELTIEKLYELHESIPRNPLIAEVCYRAGYIDSWGRGIEKISEACAQMNLPRPVLTHATGGVLVELTRPKRAEGNVGENDGRNPENVGRNSKNDGRNAEASEKNVGENGGASEKNVGENHKTSEKILTWVRENRDVTIAELSEKANVSTRSVERNIQNLQKEGKLERVGPDKGGYWEIKENE